MTEQDRPNLSLGQPPGSLKAGTGPIPSRWLWAFVALQTVMLLCLVALLLRPTAPPTSARAPQAAGDPDDLQAAALELEERGLDAQAARAWKGYLEAAPDASDRAEIFYRIGGLYLQADEFAEAAAALVRSEMAAEGDEAPPPRVIVRGRFDPLLGDVEPLFALAAGEWTKEPQLNRDQKYLVLVEKKTPARTPPFEEVRPRVEADYARIKEQELTEELFRDLLTRYEVRILAPDAGDEDKESVKPADGEPETDQESDDAASQAQEEETS